MRARPLALGALFLTAAAGFSLPAQAYCLTHGCNFQAQECPLDDNGCVQAGPLLHWRSGCVSFDLQQDGSPRREIDYDSAHQVLVESFTQWLNADCGNGQGPGIQISDYGPVVCRKPEYNQDAPNANVVMFRDQDWPYTHAIDTLALTTLIFDADSGEIFDADIEVNTHEFHMTTGPVRGIDVDLRSVLTHEVGHFLGLSHSKAEGSTMFPSYMPGLTEMASIEYDDEQGICAALPPDRPLATQSCEPRHGFSRECALPETTCGVARGTGGGAPTAFALLAGLSSVLLRRKLRRAAPRP